MPKIFYQQIAEPPVPSSAVAPVSQWQPIGLQPSRAVVYAKGTEFVAPVTSFFPTIGQWQPVCPAFLLFPELSGSEMVAPVAGDPASAIEWYPFYRQPDRPVVYAKGTEFVEPVTSLFPVVSQWQPIGLQPGRPIVYAKGSDFVEPINVMETSIGQWAPIALQPGRATTYAKGTDYVGPFPTPSTPTPLAWFPIHPQPSRAVIYAKGTEFAEPVSPITPSVAQWAPVAMQPGRVVPQIRGAEQVSPIGTSSTPMPWIPIYPQPISALQAQGGITTVEPISGVTPPPGGPLFRRSFLVPRVGNRTSRQ
jgi:hypothetical protein